MLKSLVKNIFSQSNVYKLKHWTSLNSIFWVLVIFPVFFMKYKYETPDVRF